MKMIVVKVNISKMIRDCFVLFFARTIVPLKWILSRYVTDLEEFCRKWNNFLTLNLWKYLYSIWQKLVYSHLWKDGGILNILKRAKLWVMLPFPSYFIWNDNLLILFFYCVYQIFNPRYTLSNKYIAMKHYWKTYFYFINLLAPFHILDLHLNMPILISSSL